MKSSMNQIDRPDADDGPVVSEGGRSPSTLSTGRATPSAPGAPRPGPLAPGQRWSVGRKREVVLRLLRGEPAELLSRELGLPMFKLEQWRRNAEAALDGALKGPGHCPGPRPTPPTASSPPPCSGSASSAWRTSCCAPESSGPALWAAGGRADGPGDLPHQWPALRRPACLPGLGRAALQRLRRPPAAAGQRRAASAGTPRPEAGGFRRGSARRHPEGSHPLPLDRRRPPPRSGPACACATASGCRASASCV
jgi:hypothetical protein